MNLLWISLGIGLIIGLSMSVFFGLYNRAGAETYLRTFLGVSSYDLIFNGMIFIISAGFLFLAAVSFVIRDTWYPTTRPWNFTVETIMMSFLPASVFLMMGPLRGYSLSSELFGEFALLSAKFGILHLLMQFSGFYSSVFPPLRR